MTADRPRIPEVSEGAATGEMAAIYADIRALLGVPMVNLIYRHMAAFPGLLPWAWGSVRPAVTDGTIPAAARTLAAEVALRPVAVLAEPVLRVLGVGESAHRHITAILDAYNLANPCNLLITATLLRLAAVAEDRTPASDPPPGATAPAPAAPAARAPDASAAAGGSAAADLGPPMVAPAAMAPDVAALVGGLPAEPGIVPSLYRHLANWPQLLAVQAVLLEPHRAALPGLASGLEESAGAVACRLVGDGLVRRLPAATSRPLGVQGLRVADFPSVITRMVVVGKAFAACLPAPPLSATSP